MSRQSPRFVLCPLSFVPRRGVMFYKYIVQTLDQGYKWQDGANNLLVLPDPWDVPPGSVFIQDDNFSGLTKQAQNQLAVKLIQTEKEDEAGGE